MLMNVMYVAAGGAIGAAVRYVSLKAAAALLGAGFPYGTLGVNVVGSLLMGLLAGFFAMRQTGASEPLYLLLAVGVLGGFTTFSAFSFDVIALLQRGQNLQAAAYVAVSVLLSAGALWLGLEVMR